MRIGDLCHRVTLQVKSSVADGMGGTVDTWADRASVWAAVWPTSAREIVAANSTSLVVTHRVRIRYRSDVRPTWRVKFGDRYFAIVGMVNPNEQNRTLDLMCQEATS